MAVFYPDDRMIRRGPSGSAERAPGFGNRVPHARPQGSIAAGDGGPNCFPVKSARARERLSKGSASGFSARGSGTPRVNCARP